MYIHVYIGFGHEVDSEKEMDVEILEFIYNRVYVYVHSYN